MKRLLVLFFVVLPCFSFAACWESINFDNEANMDTLAHIQALLHSKMMKLQMPQY